MKVYDKLVRDKIPEIIEASGSKCEIEIVNDNIKIEKVEFPSFYGKCSGYGLYML